jgi:hypothetical protein
MCCTTAAVNLNRVVVAVPARLPALFALNVVVRVYVMWTTKGLLTLRQGGVDVLVTL